MSSTFSYVAKSADGQMLRSSLIADSREAALSQLRGQGLTIVDLQAMGLREEAVKKQDRAHRKSRFKAAKLGRVKMEDVSLFCRQLSISINSGVPLRDSLESILEDMDSGAFRVVLQDVVDRIHEGKPFSEAISRHGRVFSPLFVALIRSAEEAGSMSETLSHLSNYLERSVKLARKIRSMTAYPIFVAVFFCVVCVIMTLFVLPQFEDIFGGYEASLPPLTVAVFSLNQFIIDNILLIAAGFFSLIAAVILYGRTKTGRRNLDRLKLSLPFFGTCLRKYAIARFCRNLGIMLNGGVPVTTAMEITSGVTGNKILEQSLLDARDRVIAGAGISSSLGEEKDIPRLVIRMMSVGEESGRMPDVMEKISEVYEDQVEEAITTAVSLFEPVIICFFGAIILVLVMAIYLPIFTVSQHVG